jgi:hypothetical protein
MVRNSLNGIHLREEFEWPWGERRGFLGTGRNPKTSEAIMIEARNIPRFTANKVFRDAVEENSDWRAHRKKFNSFMHAEGIDGKGSKEWQQKLLRAFAFCAGLIIPAPAWQNTFNYASRNIFKSSFSKKRASLRLSFTSWSRVFTHLNTGCISRYLAMPS